MELVKVRIIARGSMLSMVSYKGIRYEVNSRDLYFCKREMIDTFCYINVELLTKVWTQ